MKFEKLDISNKNIVWRMLELTPTHKDFLSKRKLKVKYVFKKDDIFWILQKSDTAGIYIDLQDSIPSDVVKAIKKQGFAKYTK